MKLGSTTFLKAAVILFGLAILAICILVLPQALIVEDDLEYQIFLSGMLLASLPLFFALYQIMKLLSYVDKNIALSELSVKSLKYVKYSTILIGVIFGAQLPFFYTIADSEDAPGVLVVGLVFTFAPIVIGTFAAVLQKILQSAIDIKVENDLTV